MDIIPSKETIFLEIEGCFFFFLLRSSVPFAVLRYILCYSMHCTFVYGILYKSDFSGKSCMLRVSLYLDYCSKLCRIN